MVKKDSCSMVGTPSKFSRPSLFNCNYCSMVANGKQLYLNLRKYNHCSLRQKAAQIPMHIYEIRKIDFRSSLLNCSCPIFTGFKTSSTMLTHLLCLHFLRFDLALGDLVSSRLHLLCLHFADLMGPPLRYSLLNIFKTWSTMLTLSTFQPANA
jgi:hypothetical protein